MSFNFYNNLQCFLTPSADYQCHEIDRELFLTSPEEALESWHQLQPQEVGHTVYFPHQMDDEEPGTLLINGIDDDELIKIPVSEKCFSPMKILQEDFNIEGPESSEVLGLLSPNEETEPKKLNKRCQKEL